MTIITPEALLKIARAGGRSTPAQKLISQELAPPLNSYLPAYGIDTVKRQSHFLAQAAVATDGFSSLQASDREGARFEGRQDLGNTRPGDGVRFKERGLFPILGRANYRNLGNQLDLLLELHPELAARPDIAVRIACQTWQNRNLNAFADAGDAQAITQRLGGTLQGLRRLQLYLHVARSVLPGERLSVEKRPTPTAADREPVREDDRNYRVWYGTNRKPRRDGQEDLSFTSERDDQVHYGWCDVHVPESHSIGSVGSSLWKRLIAFTDDRLKLSEIGSQSSDAFWRSVKEHLKSVAGSDQAAVVFIHGYNVSFERAAIQSAQIGFDLGLRGAMSFFSWPSRGTFDGYPADEATIEASEEHITNFLVDFAEKSGAADVHIIAHSMGNRGVLRAMQRIAAEADARSRKPFRQIILAAADVDADVFRQLSSAYSRAAERTTLYVSERDRAVGASGWLHDFPRAGLMPPTMIVPGIDTVSATNVDVSTLGHGYVSAARPLLADIFQLIGFGTPPDERFGLDAAEDPSGMRFWRFKL